MRQTAPRFLELKPNWDDVRARYEAFWAHELAFPIFQVTSPARNGLDHPDAAPGDASRRFVDPEVVLPALRKHVRSTFWGGDAFPCAFPVSTGLVAIMAAYLGCPYRILPALGTAWADPILQSLEDQVLAAVEANPWWQATRALLQGAAMDPERNYHIGIPDLQGDGQIAALLRGTEDLAIDVLERPEQVRALIEQIDEIWFFYWQECHRMACSQTEGYVDWLGIWSALPMATLECDFSCMISERHFRDIFLPSIVRQATLVERTIYHLDGPGALHHLESLLELPQLDGIQWVPGAGSKPMTEWVPLLRRIQAAGKLVVIACEPNEVEPLLSALDPAGLAISVSCSSQDEAERLLLAAGYPLA